MDDRRIEITGGRIGLAADNDLRRVDQGGQARDIAGADYARIVGIGLRILTVEGNQRRLRLRHERFGHRFMYIGIAGRRAPLSAPRYCAQNDFLGGVWGVGSFVDQRGIWAPSSSRTGVRFSAAARATTFPLLVLPVKKMKSKGSLRSSVVSSRRPLTRNVPTSDRPATRTNRRSADGRGQY